MNWNFRGYRCAIFVLIGSLALSGMGHPDGHVHASEDAGKVAKASGTLGIRVLSEGFNCPMEMSITPDGDIFVANRFGDLDFYDFNSGKLKQVLMLKVNHIGVKSDKWDKESGLMGVAIDPNFKKNNWLYVYYTSPGDDPDSPMNDHHLSRFTWDAKAKLVDRSSEKILLKVPAHRENRIHEAGSIAFDGDGNLYLSTGDNQSRSEYLYARKTAANTNDLKGKILRIKPTDDGGYTIPEGNLFKPGTPKTRPEVFIMGLRNPFRISVDPKTNWLLWGENGPPDRFSGNLKIDRNLLAPGYDEFNLTRKAGFYGWPLIIGDQEAFVDYEYKTGKPTIKFDPQKPINTHPENTGLKQLPPSQKALIWYAGTSEKFPAVGNGGESAIGGPIYHFENSPEGLPSKFDHSAFVADWARGWVLNAQLSQDGKLTSLDPFLPKLKFGKPINLKLGPKGRLHLLYYGEGNVKTRKTHGTLIRIENINTMQDLGSGLLTIASVIDNRNPTDGLPHNHPGVQLMAKSDCMSCHTAETHSVGPTFRTIADKYEKNDQVILSLANKVKLGGSGVWGGMYMPPHPQHTDSDLKQMVEAIFELKGGKKFMSPKNTKNTKNAKKPAGNKKKTKKPGANKKNKKQS